MKLLNFLACGFGILGFSFVLAAAIIGFVTKENVNHMDVAIVGGIFLILSALIGTAKWLYEINRSPKLSRVDFPDS